MPYNGSGGTTQPSSSFYPATANTLIESAKANTSIADIYVMLASAVLKDGQQTITANLPMAGFRLTGLGAGSVAGHSLRYEQVIGVMQPLATLTTKGDLYVATASATVARQAVGTDGQIIKAASAQTNGIQWVDNVAAIGFIIDGGGAVPTTGVKGDLLIPFACTINSATLQADASGSAVVDIWKKTYTLDSPPTVANTITASALPTLASHQSAQDATLTGWTTAIAANDMLRFNLNSVTTCQRLTLTLKVTKT